MLRYRDEPFRLFVDRVSDYAIFMLDPEGRVTTWNEGAERLKGYRAEEVIGRHFSCFYTDEDVAAGKPAAIVARAARDGRARAEGWRVRKDGSRFWADVVVTALYDDDRQLRGFGKVTRDLTERKRNEDALREAADREREAARQLRDLDRFRSELVNIVAHDLRSPVTVIEGLLDVLRRDWSDLDDARRLDILGRVAQTTERLGVLVSGIVQAARIDSQAIELRFGAVDLGVVAVRAAGDARLASRPAGDVETSSVIVHAPDEPVYAYADEDRVWQVITNLLSNALRFSPSDQPVEVDVSLVGAELVRVRVRDHGPGIPAELRPVLFDRFSRGSGPAATGQGIGLGLFIARSLVEAQGGEIWAETGDTSGATLSFTLPRHPPAATSR